MKGAFDRRKSLQELEQDDWGEPTYDSCLVTTIHRLRRKPLAEFTVEDLRIVVGQQIGLPFLIPMALERMEDDPLAAGDFYPGDLLQAVVRADQGFWANHADCLQRIRQVVRRLRKLLPSLDDVDRQTVFEVLAETPPTLAE